MSMLRTIGISLSALVGFALAFYLLYGSVITHDGSRKNFIVENTDGNDYHFKLELAKDSLLLISQGSSTLAGFSLAKKKLTFVSNPSLLSWILFMSVMLGTGLGLVLPLFYRGCQLVMAFGMSPRAWVSAAFLTALVFAAIGVPYIYIDSLNIMTAYEFAEKFEVVASNMGGARIIIYLTVSIAAITIFVMFVANSCIPKIHVPKASDAGPKPNREAEIIKLKVLSDMREAVTDMEATTGKPFALVYKMLYLDKVYEALGQSVPPPPIPSTAAIAKRYESIDSTLRFLLLSLAMLIVFSVLASAAFQQALVKAMYVNGGPNNLFPSQYVYIYGLCFTILLAFIYLPIDLHLRDEGRSVAAKLRKEIRDNVAQLKDAEKDLLILESKGSALKNFGSSLTIISPLLGSAFVDFVKSI